MAIELISKIKPKNGGDFAMVDAEDVEMPDGTRLSEAIQNVKGAGYVVQVEPPEDKSVLWLDPNDDTANETGSMAAAVDEIDALIGGDE